MNEPLDANHVEAAAATRKLASLQEQTAEARADLARVKQDVVKAEDRLESIQPQLIETHEHLLALTLRAQGDAEECADKLREVAQASERDELTGLPMRALLFDRFATAIANAKRHRARLALLFLDLDDFKRINDTLGHAVGDLALKLTADCLTSAVREADTVSRHGGDEFLILLAEVSQAQDAVIVADKIVVALEAAHRLGDQEVRLKASIGISIYPDHGADAEVLIARADAAMYLAKKQELGRVVVHS